MMHHGLGFFHVLTPPCAKSSKTCLLQKVNDLSQYVEHEQQFTTFHVEMVTLLISLLFSLG
jgi:hypothetical protein